MKYTIEVTKVTVCPIIGAAVGFYDVGGSLWCIGNPNCSPTYVGATASLLPENVPVSVPSTAGGMSEDGVLRLVAIIANNGAGTIKDILK